jgi:hypothetical protein
MLPATGGKVAKPVGVERLHGAMNIDGGERDLQVILSCRRSSSNKLGEDRLAAFA